MTFDPSYLAAYGGVGAFYQQPYSYPSYNPVDLESTRQQFVAPAASYTYYEEPRSTITPPSLQGAGLADPGFVMEQSGISGPNIVSTSALRAPKDNPYLGALYELKASNLGLAGAAAGQSYTAGQNIRNTQMSNLLADRQATEYLMQLQREVSALERLALEGDAGALEQLRAKQTEMEAILAGQQGARQEEFQRLIDAQQNVGEIAERNQINQQRAAWDTRYQRAGIAPPTEVLAPIMSPEQWASYNEQGIRPENWDVADVVAQGNLPELPQGQRWKIERPDEFLSRQYEATEQDRDLELADMQLTYNALKSQLDYQASLRGFDLARARQAHGDAAAEEQFQQYLRESGLQGQQLEYQNLIAQLEFAAYTRDLQEDLLNIQSEMWQQEFPDIPEWGEVDPTYGGQWNNRLGVWVNRNNGFTFNTAEGFWRDPQGRDVNTQWGEIAQDGGQFNNWEGVWYSADRQNVYNPTPGYEGWRPYWAPRDTEYDASWGGGAWWQPDWGGWLANDGTVAYPDGTYGRWY